MWCHTKCDGTPIETYNNVDYYRHPKYDLSEFMIYLETSHKKVASENKEIYLCGDFNIDLLKVDEMNKTSFIIT